ncbi:MAG: NAD(P)H-binding protein [Solirubrobacteraceae bacterium]|nr:NAD(P)H-binding protein [Solirubrobacteraceae bacterium]
MQILLTGASGAIGSQLAPQLAGEGHELRAFARDPKRVTAGCFDQIVRGDVLTGDGLGEALEGIELAYYLIHSMEASAEGEPFAERELRSAENFAAAARRAGLRRVCYLGGLVPSDRPPSEHLASRLAVEEALLASAPEALSLRASIVVSAQSRSFRFLVRLLERSPLLPLPDWRDFRTQPIDGRDVVAYLQAAGLSTAVEGRLVLDIAGPDAVTYGQLIQRIAGAMMVSRPAVELPFSLTPVASVVAASIAGEASELVGPLMAGLSGDLLANDEAARDLFPIQLHRLDRAISNALREWEEIEPLAAR